MVGSSTISLTASTASRTGVSARRGCCGHRLPSTAPRWAALGGEADAARTLAAWTARAANQVSLRNQQGVAWLLEELLRGRGPRGAGMRTSFLMAEAISGQVSGLRGRP